MSFIVFDNINKTYPGSTVPAVAELNLQIQQGEFLTLLGPSGSGKTTSLMMLAGFEKPSSGAILLEGQRIEKLPAYERDMGVVFQSYSLFPHMTVAQNVAFPLEMRKIARDKIKQRVLSALGKVRLEQFVDRMPSQLSGGEQQRVALARALVFDPRLVLMDEPLSALDKNLREEMQLEIRRLHRELGVTMVYVTHDQSEAMTLSDRIAVFNHGRIEQLGQPDTLYNSPINAFVATFIGDNNTVACRVLSVSDDLAKVEAAGQTFVGKMHAKRFKAGDEARLCIRPESLLLTPDRDISNRIRSSVVDMINQGDHWRVLVAPDLEHVQDQWMVKCQPTHLPAGLEPGQSLEIGFSAESAWVV